MTSKICNRCETSQSPDSYNIHCIFGCHSHTLSPTFQNGDHACLRRSTGCACDVTRVVGRHPDVGQSDPAAYRNHLLHHLAVSASFQGHPVTPPAVPELGSLVCARQTGYDEFVAGMNVGGQGVYLHVWLWYDDDVQDGRADSSSVGHTTQVLP